MTHMEELSKLFDDFTKLFDQLSTLQQEKIQAAHEDDLQALEHCMQQEQALSLQIRGMQRKKDKLHQALGLENVSLRELPQHLSAADRAQIAPSSTRFQAAYELYNSAAAASRAVLEGILHELDKALEEASKTAPQAQAPRPQGNFTDIKA